MGSKHVWESDESSTSFDVFLRTLGSSGDEVKVGEDINVVGEQLRVDFFKLSCNRLEKAGFFTGLAQLGSVNPNWRLGSAPKKPGPAEVAWLPAQPGYMSCHNTSLISHQHKSPKRSLPRSQSRCHHRSHNLLHPCWQHMHNTRRSLHILWGFE